MEKKTKVGIREIFAFAWSYWKHFKGTLFVALTAITLSTLCDVFIPIFSGKIVDALAAGAAGQDGQVEIALTALACFVGLGFLHHVFRIAGVFVWMHVAADVLRDIVKDINYRVQRFSTDWHANSFAGSTVRKITRGKWAFDLFGDTLYMGLIPTGLILVGITIMQFSQSVLIGSMFAIGFLVYIAVSVVVAIKYVAPANRKFNDSDSDVGAVLADSLTCNAVVKVFGAESREDDVLDEVNSHWKALLLKAWKRHMHIDAIQSFLLLILFGGILTAAMLRWSQGLFTAGQVMFVMTSYFMVSGYIREVGTHIRHLQKAMNEMEDAVEFSLLPIGVADIDDAQNIAVTKGKIEFDNVTFKYDNQHKATYSNLSLTIKPGEKVGLVGHSGSGKSTFVKLLQRLYDLDKGAIRIDGQDISEVSQSSLRRAVSIVPQESVLFHRTLAENIAYGRPDASMDDIVAAAKRAYAHEFIEDLAEGYDTMVGERGVKLSGGERQRIAIARAILADTPILILDEATASLDSISEYKIQKAMENMMEGRTTIIIAHRLSTIQDVDRILVFDKGVVVEQGPHAELVTLDGGQYQKLYEMQAFSLAGEEDKTLSLAS